MQIAESSITLSFPDRNFFRFQDCSSYKSIQNHFKEMDACWYDSSLNVLYLIELKDWSQAVLTDGSYTEKRIWDLVKKSIDSVCMFMSILLEKQQGLQIQACIPFKITASTKIKVLTIVNCNVSDIAFVSAINTEYKTRLNSYAKLFDIDTFSVVTKDKAIQRFNWIS